MSFISATRMIVEIPKSLKKRFPYFTAKAMSGLDSAVKRIFYQLQTVLW